MGLAMRKPQTDAMASLAEVLAPVLGPRLKREELLGPRVGYRVGGPAALFAECHSEEEAARAVALAAEHSAPVFVLGRGTNLLVRDGGIRALVISLEGALENFECIETLPEGGAKVRAGAGMTTGALVQRLQKESLGGGEFLALIPGTMGGAVRMNAGAHGGEMSQILESVQVIAPGGKLEERKAGELGLAYRKSNLKPDEIVTSMVMRFSKADPKESREKIREHAAYRQKTQPTNEPNAGSVFKNPPGDFAGRLLEQAGLKGLRVGGARVSEKHANFIVTEKGATAADVEALAKVMREKVLEKFGIALELEICLVGDA
ncbi:MAG: UDP-N-acetylmuramate dehydrogenase [Bdellovibrionota bacterium]